MQPIKEESLLSLDTADIELELNNLRSVFEADNKLLDAIYPSNTKILEFEMHNLRRALAKTMAPEGDAAAPTKEQPDADNQINEKESTNNMDCFKIFKC